MTNEKQRKMETLTPLAEGEFWRINGIGEATEKRLHAAGIDTFDMLASLAPEEIAATLTGQVGVRERVIRQDWIGQARKFAGALAKVEQPGEAGDPVDRQHYETFFVELLIDDECNIRRTRVTEVQNGEKEHWAGWDSDRLFAWLARQSGIPLEKLAPDKPAQNDPVEEDLAPLISGTIRTKNVTLSAHGSNQARRFYLAGQPFELQMTLDLTETNIQPNMLLAYEAVVQSRQMETGRRFRLGNIQGEKPAAGQMILSVPITEIEEGTYSLETFVRLHPANSTQAERDELQGTSEGGLIHIYAHNLQPA